MHYNKRCYKKKCHRPDTNDKNFTNPVYPTKVTYNISLSNVRTNEGIVIDISNISNLLNSGGNQCINADLEIPPETPVTPVTPVTKVSKVIKNVIKNVTSNKNLMKQLLSKSSLEELLKL
jgi:hypothetical protein